MKKNDEKIDVCDWCEKELPRKKLYYCEDCSTMLCNECIKIHDKEHGIE